MRQTGVRQTDRVSEYPYCQVITTVASRDAADLLGRGAVEARLAACAQVGGPITSTYWWQGVVESSEEWQVVFKTTTDRYAELEAHIRSHHSYQVPEILCLPVSAGNPSYLSWLAAETRV